MERAIEEVQRRIKAIQKKFLDKEPTIDALESAMDELAEADNVLAAGQQSMSDVAAELSELNIKVQDHFADV